MVDSALHLILDQGGSQSRALVIDARGSVRARAHVPVATQRPQTDWVEQSPTELVCSLRQSAEQVIAKLPPSERKRLIDCALVCQRSNLLIADANKPLTPVLSWQDRRGAALMPSDDQRIEQIRQLTGLYPSAHHGASKFAWLLTEHAEVRKAPAEQLRLLPLAAYLIEALTGCSGIDPGNAQRTLLLNAQRVSWDHSLCTLFGIPQRALPPLRASFGDWGTLSVAGCHLPCRLLAGDQAVAPLAEGALANGMVQITLGSGAFVIANAPSDLPPHRLLASIAWSNATGMQRWLEGSVNGCAAALQAMALTLPDQPASKPALFLNAEGGLASPFWRSDLPSRLLGTAQHDPATGVAESWLFLLQENINALKQAGVAVSALRLGGGLQRRWLAQALADISQLPVMLAAEQETTARGAAWLLAGQPKAWQQGVQARFIPTPNPSLINRYRRWRRALGYWLQR